MTLKKINNFLLITIVIAGTLLFVYAAKKATESNMKAHECPDSTQVENHRSEFIFFEAIGNRFFVSSKD